MHGTPMPIRLRRALTEWLERAQQARRVDLVSPSAVAEGLLGALEARALNRLLGGPAYVLGDDAAFLDGLLHGLVPERTEDDDPSDPPNPEVSE